MKYFAGIGSRKITDNEKSHIKMVCDFLSQYDYICLSGNATGSDVTFQKYCKHVALLPYESFNFEEMIPSQYFVVDLSDQEATNSIKQFHPNPSALYDKGKKYMARNYRQIKFKDNIFADFVICVADEDKQGNVKGGTGQACRIANFYNIPVYNLRYISPEEVIAKLKFQFTLYEN